MNDNDLARIADARLLAAMRAVNPPLETLMADRLALRQEVQSTQMQLDDARERENELGRIREVLIPGYIGAAKAITLLAAIAALAVLTTALFTDLFEIKAPAALFASLLVPLWLVELAERRFGRWRFRIGARFRPEFLHADALAEL